MNHYESKKEGAFKQVKVSDALVSLAKKLISADADMMKEQLLVKLLMSIDAKFFSYKFQAAKTSDYETILKAINDFYNDMRKERIKKIFIVKNSYTEKFVHLFQLVIDLAFNISESEK